MAKTVVSVAILEPTLDPNMNEGGNFAFDGQTTLTGGGAADYDAHYQWDQGTGTWIDLAGTGALNTANTNPQVNITQKNFATITVTADTAGSYEVRIRTVDHNDSDAEDLSSQLTITVNAGGGGSGRRIFITT